MAADEYTPTVLTIAGFDPYGGAGIQIDTKTIHALGGYAFSVVTAVTAQNSRGVSGVEAVSPQMLRLQLDTLLKDVKVDAVKIGYWHWHSGVGYRSLLDDCRAKMAGFARLAERYGVKACVHNHSGRTMTLSAIATLNIVRDFDPRHVGVFADVGHLSLVGEPLPMALELMWDYIHMFALKDLVWQKEVGSLEAPRRHKVVPFGHGLVEWASFVDVLRGRGYDGVLCLHSEYADYPPESLFDQAAIDRRFLERLFAQADAN